MIVLKEFFMRTRRRDNKITARLKCLWCWEDFKDG